MSFKIGQTVIITQDGVNRVAVILDKYPINKNIVYDVLLETRSALCMVSTSIKSNLYINKALTSMLCDTEMIETTIPYKQLVAEDALPIIKS